ncbi:MAG TPA: hypothetical protein VL588_00390 [Bdellovibrionota bacterium]|jgi:hypothetical protein|nr:hypothetical protein [Bdellovibrionota bacterium]
MIEKAPKLTIQNHAHGFLVDAEWMGGVCESPERPGSYLAYVLEPETGTYVSAHHFERLEDAVEALNRIPRDWAFEAASECGQGKCGKTGTCETGGHAAICGGCGLNPLENSPVEGYPSP